MRASNDTEPARRTEPGRRPRVLLVTATFPPTRCGVGDYARCLCEGLSRDVTVFVLTGAREDPSHQHAHADRLPPVPPPPPVRTVSAPVFEEEVEGVWVSRSVSTWDWSALDTIRAALVDVDPSLISLQYHGEDYLLHPAICRLPAVASALDVPTVTTLHNLQSPRRWDESVDPLQLLLGESAAWITTNAIDTGVLAPLDDTAGKLHEVSAGPCLQAPADRAWNPPRGPFRVAYFGFLNPFKGIEYLLRAVALLRDEGLDLRLTLAAGLHTDAPERLCRYAELVEREIERLDLEPLLDRFGYLENPAVSDLLLSSHLAVFPFRDGLSSKNSSFWSTLDHGTPTLTTRGPGLPADLIANEHVLLAAARDPRDLAERIRWAMEHPDELRALGRRGQDFVRRRLGWALLAGRTLEVFDASLARSGKVAGA